MPCLRRTLVSVLSTQLAGQGEGGCREAARRAVRTAIVSKVRIAEGLRVSVETLLRLLLNELLLCTSSGGES